ncbi:hypothetical protein [Kitasatospora sp. NPDC056731]|uniref:hypothetical protein n=1 Tax=Kitasatospora sp. NPDC056731 TaxID=3155422 RepID=UPI00342D3A0D
MKGAGKAALVGLALAAGTVTVVLGLSARWPVWLWAVPAVVAAVLAALLAMARAPESEAEVGTDADSESDEPPYEETRVDRVALPSRVPDYDFIFSVTVWWRPIPNMTGLVHASPASLAIETVLSRAREVTENEDPGRLDLVRHQLNGVLGIQGQDPSALVEVMGGRVSLSLPEDDRSRLGKLSEVRKTEEVWEHERRYEQSKRAYLGEDVLKSPGSAVVWWLARHDDEVVQAVDMIGPLAQLSAAANNEAVDELYEHLVPRPVDEAGPFQDDVTPRWPRGGDEGEDWAAPWSPRTPGPEGPNGSGTGPRVVGPLNQLLDDVDLMKDSPERRLYAHRVAEFTDAMGRPNQASLIRESLRGDGDGGAGAVPGQQRPAEDRSDGPFGSWGKVDSGLNGFVASGTSHGTGHGSEDWDEG